MKKRLVEIGLYLLGGLLILFSLTIDIFRGHHFGFGIIQGFVFLIGALLILCVWLIKKKKFKQAIIPILFFCLVCVFIILKIKIFELDGFRTWNDTLSYVSTTITPINTLGFWNGERPFILPLIYKFFGVNDTNYFDVTLMRDILKLQLITGILSWSILAYSVSRLFTQRLIKSVSFFLVFALGLGLTASMWDKLLLSESFSNSFFILLISLLLILFSTNKEKRVVTVLLSIAMGIISILYLFIRDANGYIILFGSVIGLIYWLFIGKTQSSKKVILGISLAGIVLSVTSLGLLNLSTRWWAPIQHVLYDRRSTIAELAPYFEENGFDLSVNLPYLKDPLAFKKENISVDPLIKSQKLKSAKELYFKYLLTHPKYTFITPYSDANNIFNPNNLPYRYTIEPTPLWVDQLNQIIYPKGLWVIAVGVFSCVSCLIFSRRTYKPAILLVLFLILSYIPLGMLYWLSDSVEIQRHSQQLFLQSRIGFWISILFFIDFVVGKVNLRRKEPQTS